MAKDQRYARRTMVSLFKLLLAAFVLAVVILAGAGFGMMKGILDDSPDINKVSIKPKGFKTNILDQDGNVLDTLSTVNSNRVYVYYDDIPELMVDAFVSIEDERFWTHNGIDARGILRAFVKDVSAGNFNEGASTITQQLVKNQVFDVGMNETTNLQKVERKVQEQYLAVELEKRYTKKQIMEYYLNTIYLGQGVNGVEAAAERYFNKKIEDLTLSEITVIAGITKNPYQFDPVLYPEVNNERRMDVLNKMLELGYIDDKQYDTAKNDDVYSRIQAVKQEAEENFQYNSYYTDALMRALVADFENMYGMTEKEAYNEIYSGGYSVYSVQDKKIQDIVDTEVNDPQYYPATSEVALNYKLTLLDPDGETQLNYDTNTMLTYYRNLTGNSKYNNIYPDRASAREAATTYKEAMLDKTGGTYVTEEFDTSIQPQASFVVIDQHTGYVKAINGGRGKKNGNLGFNRATDAMRQPGSTFKVLASFLPFIDTGGGLVDCFNDQPYEFENGTPVKNWYSGYRGWSSIRDAIRDSMNIIAVETITDVTPEKAFEYLEKMGFTTLVKKETSSDGEIFSDVQQATALGGLTYGITNLEITAAFASIANMGTYEKPVYYSKVYDHDGNLVIDNTDPTANAKEICKKTTAYQLIDAMKDVVTSGTGTAAKLATGGVAAGKTGTTSNNYDHWFCGMTPYYTASVWFGYDSNIELNTDNHKVLWRNIMDQIAEEEGQDPKKDWERPAGLEEVTVCRETGLLPGPGCPTNTDLMAAEDKPTKRCKGGYTEKTITICMDSHLRATNTCPDTQTFQIKYDKKGNLTLIGADFPYDQNILTTFCPLHPMVQTYAIATQAGAGGTISTTVNAKEGSDVTIYITPDAGYTIHDVTVDGASVGAVSSYNFENVTEGHTVTATFMAPDGTIGELKTETTEQQGSTTSGSDTGTSGSTTSSTAQTGSTTAPSSETTSAPVTEAAPVQQ